MKLLKIFLFIAVFIGSYTGAVQAEPMAPKGPLDGIWDIKDEGNELYDALSLTISHQFTGVGHRTSEDPLYAIGVVKWPEADYLAEATGTINYLADGTVTLKFGQFEYCNCVAVHYTLKPSNDPNILIGKWVFNKGNDKETTGKSVWVRRPAAKIKSINYSISSADPEQRFIRHEAEYKKEPLKIERRYTPGSLWINIMGERLVGGHNFWIDDENETIQLRKMGWLCEDGRHATYDWKGCGSKKTIGDGVVGIRFALRITKPLDPGLRTMWLGGEPIEFEIYEKPVDISGLWQQTDFEDIRWTINQNENKVNGSYIGPFEKGGFEGVVEGKRATFKFKHTWQLNKAVDDLNSGTIDCDYVEAEDRLHCKTIDAIHSKGYEFILKRLDPETISKPVPLPPDGVIPVLGAERDIQGDSLDDKNCNCDAITLGRVDYKKHMGQKGSILGWGEKRRHVFETTTLFSLAKDDEAANIIIPGLNPVDQACFYLTYPQELAYTTQEGKDPLCRTVVYVNFPHSRMIGRGGRTSDWQLYSVRGALDTETHTKNFVCITSASKHETVGPGKGRIYWSVKGRECPNARELTFLAPKEE